MQKQKRKHQRSNKDCGCDATHEGSVAIQHGMCSARKGIAHWSFFRFLSSFRSTNIKKNCSECHETSRNAKEKIKVLLFWGVKINFFVSFWPWRLLKVRNAQKGELPPPPDSHIFPEWCVLISRTLQADLHILGYFWSKQFKIFSNHSMVKSGLFVFCSVWLQRFIGS